MFLAVSSMKLSALKEERRKRSFFSLFAGVCLFVRFFFCESAVNCDVFFNCITKKHLQISVGSERIVSLKSFLV